MNFLCFINDGCIFFLFAGGVEAVRERVGGDGESITLSLILKCYVGDGVLWECYLGESVCSLRLAEYARGVLDAFVLI